MFEPTILDSMIDERIPGGLGGNWYGVYPALVTDLNDPDGQGRVKITLPWSADSGSERYEAWARIATMMGGGSRGTWFIPDKDDEVLIAFEGGNSRRPYVLGGLWNGSDAPPTSMDGAGNNDIKMIKSRNGVKVTLDDQDGQEKLILETPGGQKVKLTDGPGVVEIADSNGNSIKLEAAGITITASAKITLNGSLIEASAGSVSVSAGMSRFSGVVQADTVIGSSIVGSSYTPGAGNIW
jgi:uncharacterized protein involved in type VI secretion and phage assembly